MSGCVNPPSLRHHSLSNLFISYTKKIYFKIHFLHFLDHQIIFLYTHDQIWQYHVFYEFFFVNVLLLCYTKRIFFEILLNQSEIRLYLPFSDWFWTKRKSVWFKINQKMVKSILWAEVYPIQVIAPPMGGNVRLLTWLSSRTAKR